VKAQKSNVMFPVFLLLVALLFTLSSEATANDQDKKLAHQPGGQASAHLSPKAGVNSNAQWSADPTRGWIRADERHELRKTRVPKQSNTDKGKSKVKAKAGS